MGMCTRPDPKPDRGTDAEADTASRLRACTWMVTLERVHALVLWRAADTLAQHFARGRAWWRSVR